MVPPPPTRKCGGGIYYKNVQRADDRHPPPPFGGEGCRSLSELNNVIIPHFIKYPADDHQKYFAWSSDGRWRRRRVLYWICCNKAILLKKSSCSLISSRCKDPNTWIIWILFLCKIYCARIYIKKEKRALKLDSPQLANFTAADLEL